MAIKGWKRPSAEERAEHVRTLERLGNLVVDRTGPISVWFVLLSGFDEHPQLAADRPAHR